MLATQISFDTQAPARLLSLRRLLRRLRPLKLEAIAAKLRGFDYEFRARRLVNLYAPGQPTQAIWGGWLDNLELALRQVEANGFFEVDWDLLESDWQMAMSGDEGDDLMARWLYEIPIQRYGFSDYDEDWPEQYPVMAVIKGLLVADWGDEYLAMMIDEYGLAADWHSITCQQLNERVYAADFSGYPEPLCWLPLMAEIACNRTGDPLLDFSNFYEDEPPAYQWSEIEEAQAAYQRAKPSVSKMRAFLTWCNEPGDLQEVVDALVGKQDKPKRKRGRKPARLTALVDALTPGVER